METPNTDLQSEGQGVDRSRQIVELLDLADRHIKEGNYDAALEVIRAAQAQDQENRFALAYVERVQALLNAKKGKGAGGKKASQYGPAPAGPQMSRRQPDVSASQFAPSEGREAAFKNRIEAIFARVKEYQSSGNFPRAIEELGRVRLLDPESSQAASLEAEIRKAMEVQKVRDTEAQIRRRQDEERRKISLMEMEQARVRQEKEQARQRDEEARRAVQQEKIRQYLANAREFLESGRHAEASDQLAFVVVIDPANVEAGELQLRIREAEERKRQAELELRRRKAEEEQQRQAAVRAAVRKHIDRALGLASDGNYAEALRVITRAYVVDPMSEEVRDCEQRILDTQERAYRAAEEEKRVAEIAEEERREEELRRATEAERARLVAEQNEAAELEKRRSRETISQHLSRAEQFLSAQKFHDALAEVAQAFAIDPFDENVKRVEQMIVREQGRQAKAAASPPERSGTEEPEKAARREVAVRLSEAKRLRKDGDLSRALDELTKAFVLDPLNAEVSSLEAEIESEIQGKRAGRGEGHRTAASRDDDSKHESDHRQAAGGTDSGSQRQGKADKHVARAKDLLAARSFEDAIAEVAIGLTLDPAHAELRAVEAAIWEAMNEPVLDEENSRRVQIHLLAAEQFQKKGEFDRALDEVAKAYQIDPMNEEIKKRENLIRQDELRREHPGETPLKLIYPQKDVASGSR